MRGVIVFMGFAFLFVCVRLCAAHLKMRHA